MWSLMWFHWTVRIGSHQNLWLGRVTGSYSLVVQLLWCARIWWCSRAWEGTLYIFPLYSFRSGRRRRNVNLRVFAANLVVHSPLLFKAWSRFFFFLVSSACLNFVRAFGQVLLFEARNDCCYVLTAWVLLSISKVCQKVTFFVALESLKAFLLLSGSFNGLHLERTFRYS